MRIVTEQVLGSLLSRLDNVPRVVIGGNFATPWPALGVLDKALGRYRLFVGGLIGARVGPIEEFEVCDA